MPPPTVGFVPVSFGDLPGWGRDDLAAALPAWRRSCARILGLSPETALGPEERGGTAGDWRAVCAGVNDLPARSDVVRRHIEAHLVPFEVRAAGQSEGLFTGYFEPVFAGSRTRSDRFHVSLHGIPRDQVEVRLGDFDPKLDGRTLIGQVVDGRLRPYHRRGDIQNGAIAGQGVELVWLEDELDAFILHIQGSGQIRLETGTTLRVGFAGHNGFDYVSVGQWLIGQGELPENQASFRDIRAWLDRNPERARDVLAINQRYIFFREIDGEGPIGASGEVLTPQRSLAVDSRLMPLSVPYWLDAAHPIPGQGRLQRLMMAQDTGNAIRGAVRGDFYWGVGEEALAFAGRMKSSGRYYILLPRSLAATG